MSTDRKKIYYWLIDSKIKNHLLIEMSKIRERKSTIDCRCNRLTDWLTFKTRRSTIDCHSRRLTIILVDSRCVKWKWNTFIVLKERISSFSQVHDHFRWLTIRIVNNIHRLQRQNFTLWRFSLISRIFTSSLTILFLISSRKSHYFEKVIACCFICFIRSLLSIINRYLVILWESIDLRKLKVVVVLMNLMFCFFRSLMIWRS